MSTSKDCVEPQEMVRNALRRAYSMGQRYWQLADSDFTSDHRKSDIVEVQFNALVEATVTQMQMRGPSDIFARNPAATA